MTGAALENPVRPSKRLKRGRRSAWEPCTAILKVEARQVQRLRTPCGHRKGWSAAGAALENPVRPSFLAWPPQGPTTNWTPATPLSMLRCVDAIATKKWIPIWGCDLRQNFFLMAISSKGETATFKLPSNIEDGARDLNIRQILILDLQLQVWSLEAQTSTILLCRRHSWECRCRDSPQEL